MVAFIGSGHLGSNFVRAMLRKGERVHVWNRTLSKAQALEPLGAKVFTSVKDAVKGVKRIHLTLSDDNSVDEILDLAHSAFAPGVAVIDHTTTSASGAARRTQFWKDKGITFIHAPVFMGPQNALDSTGHMLASGDREALRTVEEHLKTMTGELIWLGPEPGKAAAIKLLGNSFLLTLTAGIADILALAKALDISPHDTLSFFEIWNPGAVMPGRMKKIIAGNFDNPAWELKMARKDAGIMMAEAVAGGMPLAFIPAIAEEMDHWIAKGAGSKDWTILAKDALP